ncbi:hypothetical protein LOZ39_001119 [Ophidiomyces ophidiicola]|uniref:uncharacterized protein n=1 Tax=Ophidiomyces ophidiicola TaxID=1387563 RepID=UPI0020C527D8|nr:uncharacterized protein LOZ57_002039 [Ophidiomyces ophidiicola]KAI1915507.1 hypothetical protein LOZ64_003536 [Ophidiomyces ophidiicola]KAI1950480.1 hypothetical protein LOZ57_002039 [Ophidiomyces ophidiicola]KAI2000374.1 hypothetical protein LOZ50_005979 [Ophidiomyces ophidiicola]KAI2014656.1 hypothetical protein LOZ49_001189 [Ophidiomyces ophidiicola]KAI2017139.1 hypothetical protein LOZ46_004608 [Ophidiomyces ophidiicola]
MPGVRSRFIEHFDPEMPWTFSDADVRLEEILAEQDHRIRSSCSSTSSGKDSLDKERPEPAFKKLGWKVKLKMGQLGR